MWKLHVKTYEIDDEGQAMPVVEHIFYGQTRAEAEHYERSHRKADSFLRGCGGDSETNWRGIRCYSESWWSKT